MLCLCSSCRWSSPVRPAGPWPTAAPSTRVQPCWAPVPRETAVESAGRPELVLQQESQSAAVSHLQKGATHPATDRPVPHKHPQDRSAFCFFWLYCPPLKTGGCQQWCRAVCELFVLFLKMNDCIKNILLSISSARLSCVWFYVKCWQIFLVSSIRHLYIKKTHTIGWSCTCNLNIYFSGKTSSDCWH